MWMLPLVVLLLHSRCPCCCGWKVGGRNLEDFPKKNKKQNGKSFQFWVRSFFCDYIYIYIFILYLYIHSDATCQNVRRNLGFGHKNRQLDLEAWVPHVFPTYHQYDNDGDDDDDDDHITHTIHVSYIYLPLPEKITSTKCR